VKNALRKAMYSDVAIVYFSCKATQVPATTDKSEEDGLDECIQLYDGLLYDNEIWDILQTARGRVFVMFETSHAGSMFKAGSDGLEKSILVDLYDEMIADEKKVRENGLNLLVWSACMDGEELPERSIGSKFTNAFYFKSDRFYTYRETFDRIQKSLGNKQNIQKTVIGEDFQDLTLFR